MTFITDHLARVLLSSQISTRPKTFITDHLRYCPHFLASHVKNCRQYRIREASPPNLQTVSNTRGFNSKSEDSIEDDLWWKFLVLWWFVMKLKPARDDLWWKSFLGHVSAKTFIFDVFYFSWAGGGPAKNLYFWMSRMLGLGASQMRYCLQLWLQKLKSEDSIASERLQSPKVPTVSCLRGFRYKSEDSLEDDLWWKFLVLWWYVMKVMFGGCLC